jgi:antitoxin CcdA
MPDTKKYTLNIEIAIQKVFSTVQSQKTTPSSVDTLSAALSVFLFEYSSKGSNSFILLYRSIFEVVYTGYVTVSAKIDEELRRRLAELSIKPSEVIKRALKEEVERRTREELRGKVERASEVISKAGGKNWMQAIRETRDEA